MSKQDNDSREQRTTAAGRLKSIERLEALYRLRAQAEDSDRLQMLQSIED